MSTTLIVTKNQLHTFYDYILWKSVTTSVLLDIDIVVCCRREGSDSGWVSD